MAGTNARVTEGEIKVKGIILSSNVDYTNPTEVRLNILTRDPVTAETVTLENVLLKQANPAFPQAVSENQQIEVVVPSYQQYRSKIVTNMYAVAPPEPPPIQNKALPEPVKFKSTVDNFSCKPSGICKSLQEKQKRIEGQLGITSNRNDLTIIQGKSNGSSPGVAIHQGNGDLYVFDGTGKQFIKMSSTDGVGIRAGHVDVGSAKQNKNSLATAGFSAYENPVGDVLPQGTILTPHPKYLPDILKIMNTVLPIIDLIDLGKACYEAKKIIYDKKSTSDINKSRSDINALEKHLSGEKMDSQTESSVKKYTSNK